MKVVKKPTVKRKVRMKDILQAAQVIANLSSQKPVNACVFAVNMDASSTGGTISNLHGCRSVFIPNGTTIVSKAIGFLYDAPFGTINNDDT